MSTKFPLYDSLMKIIPNKDLTQKQKTDFIKKIKKLDQRGKELTYILIKIYQMNHETDTSFLTPYESKTTDKNITFNLGNLPIVLRQLLYTFINKHLEMK